LTGGHLTALYLKVPRKASHRTSKIVILIRAVKVEKLASRGKFILTITGVRVIIYANGPFNTRSSYIYFSAKVNIKSRACKDFV